MTIRDLWRMRLLQHAAHMLAPLDGTYELFAAEVESMSGVGLEMMFLPTAHRSSAPHQHDAEPCDHEMARWVYVGAEACLDDADPSPSATTTRAGCGRLALLRAHGFDPRAPPKDKPGKLGVKRKIRDLALLQRDVFTESHSTPLGDGIGMPANSKKPRSRLGVPPDCSPELGEGAALWAPQAQNHQLPAERRRDRGRRGARARGVV